MSAAAQILHPQAVRDHKTTQKSFAMNAALWTSQVLWGVSFSFTGFGKILALNPTVWNQMLPRVPWFSAVPQGLFVFIGVCEFLGGIGLILPAMTRIKPKLVPLAAFGLTLVMVLAAGFHIARGEYAFFVPINVVLGAGSAFIAYGRRVVRPIASASISALRVMSGLAVLAALAFGGLVSSLVSVDTHALTNGF